MALAGLFKPDSEKLIFVIWFPFCVFIFGIDSQTNTRNRSETHLVFYSQVWHILLCWLDHAAQQLILISIHFFSNKLFSGCVKSECQQYQKKVHLTYKVVVRKKVGANNTLSALPSQRCEALDKLLLSLEPVFSSVKWAQQ